MATGKFLSLEQFTFIAVPPERQISRWQAGFEREIRRGTKWKGSRNKVYR